MLLLWSDVCWFVLVERGGCTVACLGTPCRGLTQDIRRRQSGAGSVGHCHAPWVRVSGRWMCSVDEEHVGGTGQCLVVGWSLHR